jgi:uncharacterized protein YicC (UPF0701 family)
MTIDEVILAQRLRELRRDAVEAEMCITNTRSQVAEGLARIDKHEARLEKLTVRIEATEKALYWVRLAELLHTPCVFYRVAA